MKADYDYTISKGLTIFAVILILLAIVLALTSCKVISPMDKDNDIYQYAEGGVWTIEKDSTYKWR